jgi:thioredoxin 2
MSGKLKIVCLACGAVNAVPEGKLGAAPKCGVCGDRLMDGKVRELDADVLAKALRVDQVPLVVDYWAPWCGPCKMMAPEFANSARELAGTARYAKINTEDYPQATQGRNIRGIPALIAFRGGREIARQTGAQRAAAITTWVKGAASA